MLFLQHLVSLKSFQNKKWNQRTSSYVTPFFFSYHTSNGAQNPVCSCNLQSDHLKPSLLPPRSELCSPPVWTVPHCSPPTLVTVCTEAIVIFKTRADLSAIQYTPVAPHLTWGKQSLYNSLQAPHDLALYYLQSSSYISLPLTPFQPHGLPFCSLNIPYMPPHRALALAIPLSRMHFLQIFVELLEW